MPKKGSKNRGRTSTAAAGARARRDRAAALAEARATKRRARGEDPSEYSPASSRKRAEKFLLSTRRKVTPATMSLAIAAVQAGDMADRMYALARDAHGEAASRLSTAFVALLKERRALFEQLELPGDEIEAEEIEEGEAAREERDTGGESGASDDLEVYE